MHERLQALYKELDIDSDTMAVDALDRLEQWIKEHLSHDIIESNATVERRALKYKEVLIKYFNAKEYSLFSSSRLEFAVRYGLDMLLNEIPLAETEISKLRGLVELACTLGHVHTAKKLIEQRHFIPADGRILHRTLMLPMQFDAQLKENKEKIAQFLLSLWPDLIYSKTEENNNLFHTFAENDYSKLIESYKINHDDLIKQTNNLGYHPIHVAVMNHQHESVKQLLLVGEGAQSLDDKKRTPLHHASRLGDLQMVTLCIQVAPTVVNSTDINNQTALDMAYEFNHTQVVELLTSYGGQNSMSRVKGVIG